MNIAKKLRHIYDYTSIFKKNVLKKINISHATVTIDLADPANHFGDVLFFAPLVAGLLDNGYKVNVIDNNFVLDKLFGMVKYDVDDSYTIYRGNEVKNIHASYRVNFYSCPPLPISQYIYNMFLESESYSNSLDIVKDKLHYMAMQLNNSYLKSSLDGFNKFVLIAPGLKSRRFGLTPNSELIYDSFVNAAHKHKLMGRKLILIGNKSDDFARRRFNWSSLVDLDLRGETSWSDLPGMITHPNYASIISYDTFPYHLATIFEENAEMFSRSWTTGWEYSWIKRRFMPAF